MTIHKVCVNTLVIVYMSKLSLLTRPRKISKAWFQLECNSALNIEEKNADKNFHKIIILDFQLIIQFLASYTENKGHTRAARGEI